MTLEQQIKNYILSLAEPKRSEMEALNRMVLQLAPDCKLWFFDGKNSENKIVANPNIGYGMHTIQYANGETKAWYKIGISANTTGISIYIFGITDKAYLLRTFGPRLGKASVSGYCIKFKTLQDIDTSILQEAINYGFENT